MKIDFTIDAKKLMCNIEKANDRTVEYKMIGELFEPISISFHSQLSDIIEKIKSDTVKEKTVNTKIMQLEFYFNTEFSKLHETDISKLSARKQIAKIVLDSGVKTGKYEQKKATYIVRKIQENVTACFESKVIKYNRINLHNKLLTAYAAELFSYRMNQQSFNLGERLGQAEREEAQVKSLYLISTSKSNQMSLLYLIETNLYLQENRGCSLINDNELSELYSFAQCIVALQNNSDLCFHTDSKTQLLVLDDYRIDVELGEVFSKKQEIAEKRRLGSKTYEIKGDDADKDYFEKVSKAFKTDTGVDFNVFQAVMNQLSGIGFHLEEIGSKEISPNVLKINCQEAIRDFQECVKENIEVDDIKAAYDFLTLEPSLLKTLDNVSHPYLPIWDRKNRANAFAVKPLIKMGNEYIFSPIILDELNKRWTHGLLQFYPPFEIGLQNTKAAILKWKEYYEGLFSTDVEDLFKSLNFEYYKHDVDIRRDDRAGNHPPINVLGDYDVLGLSKELKTIFIIECKFLQPIGSIFEHSTQQKEFFLEEKFDEKFQKRIDYFKKVYISFFKNIGFDYVDENYKIKPFMVVNKVFDSYYKEVLFPIVTFDELEKEISNLKTN